MKSFLSYAAAAVVLSAIAFALGAYQTDIYRKMLLWIALAISYNFLFGISGQIAFSHFSFYGIGAYTIVILVTQAGLPLPLAVLATVAVCVALALVVAIPATRLEGFYLALATLAFAQLFIVVLNEGGAITGGTGGLASYRLPDIFGVHVTGPWYTVVIVVLTLATMAIIGRLDRSWFGRACRAVRDNPEAAAAMGVNVRRTKIIAYAVTSALAGVAGMVYAFVDNTVNPHIFGLENVFLLLFMVIVGGSGRMAGAILGAVLLYLMPFVLSPLIGHHHALVFGVFMVLAVLFQPRGLIGLWDKLRGRRHRPSAARPRLPAAEAKAVKREGLA
ncbi:branched-chain amino acid ABC transporter permease [Pigmentiphaga kullae]|uniref:Amino acid/amide ABC transporter membrane protein 2 (HAAT family) n=1 Tax=Pigmentiphaga kullae TaxID=151784 RepID=A0A4Q7NJJ2_9BURK|nr:branched-chain amino acid ABC transporter permease [Pigmentiphaga kullae]RZS85129.1 amino acid/amide ABC transporter membrane protein 2 (HAAT family) [Pigmentiphaga kullae]